MAESDDADAPLLMALPMFARVAGGVAMWTDAEGVCLRAVGPDGKRRLELEGTRNELCRDAARRRRPLATAEGDIRRESLAVPLGDGVLAVSNADRAERKTQLFDTLKATLPLIAEVAGGEAVLFDHTGRRMLTADPVTRRVATGPGTVSESCLQVMQTGTPEISPSRTIPGATAVRIPITRAFGFGFNNALATRQKVKLLDRVQRQRTAKYTWDDIVSVGPALEPALELARSAAASSSPVLILGESGTGKELIAQAIHNASDRSDRPFIAVNCAAVPESLVEGTFFGHVDGAFTGARRGGQAGLFEQANGGTVLLDEISEMPLDMQAKLLRVLQEKEVRRIGATRTTPVDVRVVCTSNRDLAGAIDDGSFRADLFYRLNVIDIPLPSLRERKEDIPTLTNAILSRLAVQEQRPPPRVAPETLSRLSTYDWPGNIRELQNVLERAFSLGPEDVLLPRHLPAKLRGDDDPAGDGAHTNGGTRLADQVAAAELAIVEDTLRRCDGNRTAAARELGISVTTLWRRLRKAGGAGTAQGRQRRGA